MKHVEYEDIVADLEAHPDKRIFWRSGFAYKGGRVQEISRNPKDYPKYAGTWIRGFQEPPLLHSWKDDLKRKYDWACLVEIESESDKELHLQGLSENDMY